MDIGSWTGNNLFIGGPGFNILSGFKIIINLKFEQANEDMQLKTV